MVITGGAEASQPFLIIGLTNVSETPCTLAGYPGLSVRGNDGAGGPLRTLSNITAKGIVYEHADPGIHPVVLAAGRRAQFAIGTATAYDGGVTEIWRVDIALPASAGSVTLGLSAPLPASGRPIRIGVTAFEASAPGSAVASALVAPDDSGAVFFEGAVLPMPAGWVARIVEAGTWPALCLSRAGQPAPSTRHACPMWLRGISADSAGREPDVGDSVTVVCPDLRLLDFRRTTLGGRQADYRRWAVVCGAGARSSVEQYLVATGPGYTWCSERADAAVHAVLARLRSVIQLPRQTTALPYEVIGTVAAVRHVGTEYHVTVQPSESYDGGRVQPMPGAVPERFVVPDRLMPARVALAGLVRLRTDGSRVTGVAILG